MALTTVANVVITLYVGAAVIWRRRRRFVTALTAAFAAWAVFYFAAEAFWKSQRTHGVDFNSYYLAAKLLLAGRDPYADFAFYHRTGGGPAAEVLAAYGLDISPAPMYPPPFYILVAPLFHFNFSTAFLLWSAANTLFALAAVYAAWRAVNARGNWGLVAAAALTLAANPTVDNFYLGQANILMALIVAGGIWAYARGRAYLAGVLVGAATLLKLFPAVLLIYFVLRRRHRELVAAVATLAAAGVISAVAWGPGIWVSYLQHAVVPVMTTPVVHAVNTSVATTFVWFWPSTAAAPQIYGLTKGLVLILLICSILYLAKKRLDDVGETSFLVFAALAASSWVTQPHLVALIVTYFYFGYKLFSRQLPAGPATLAVTSFVVTALRYDYRKLALAGWPTSTLCAVKPAALILLAAVYLRYTKTRRDTDRGTTL